jgi:hypothetical protein
MLFAELGIEINKKFKYFFHNLKAALWKIVSTRGKKRSPKNPLKNAISFKSSRKKTLIFSS